MNEMRRNAKKRPAVKKVFALLLALSMFCALLAGCGKKDSSCWSDVWSDRNGYGQADEGCRRWDCKGRI